MTQKTRTLTTLRNVGPRSAAWLTAIDIYSADELAALGAVEAYCRIKEMQPGVSLNLLYALQGALLDLHWTDLPPDMKEDLRRQAEQNC